MPCPIGRSTTMQIQEGCCCRTRMAGRGSWLIHTDKAQWTIWTRRNSDSWLTTDRLAQGHFVQGTPSSTCSARLDDAVLFASCKEARCHVPTLLGMRPAHPSIMTSYRTSPSSLVHILSFLINISICFKSLNNWKFNLEKRKCES